MNKESLESYKNLINQLWESVGKKEMKMTDEEFYESVIKFIEQYLKIEKENKEVQTRIDKAIKYINEHKHLSMFADCREPEEDWIYDLEITANELLDILKGSDNNV